MELLPRHLAVIFLVAGVMLSGACHRSPAVGANFAPVSEKDRIQAERWTQATRGLDLDTETSQVRVERIEAGDPQSAAVHLAQADELLAKNRVMDALQQYGLAVRHDPDLASGYVGIGVVAKRKGKLDVAIAAFRTAIDRAPDHLEARYQWAMALWSAGRQQDAIARMRDVLELDADHAKAHERLAVWSYYTSDYATAWRHVHRATQLGETLPAQLTTLLAGRMPDPGAADGDD